MKRSGIIVLAGVLLAGAVAAQEPTDTVIEPGSKRAYPVNIEAGTTDQTHALVGMGVRTKTFLNVKVYAVGFYIDPHAAAESLSEWAGKEPKELEKDKALFARVLQMDMGMTLRLVMTRDVDGEKMASAFDDALAPRIEKATAEMDMADGTEALTQFRGYFSLDKVTDDSELIFSCVDGTLYTTIQGVVAEDIDSATLCWALFDLYIGEKPISKGAKKNIGKGFATLLSGMGHEGESGD